MFNQPISPGPQSITGPTCTIQRKHGQFRVSNPPRLHVFGLWEEVIGRLSKLSTERLWSPRNVRTHNPLAVRQWCTTVPLIIGNIWFKLFAVSEQTQRTLAIFYLKTFCRSCSAEILHPAELLSPQRQYLISKPMSCKPPGTSKGVTLLTL